MNHKTIKAFNLLKGKKYHEFFFNLLEKIPYSVFRYNSFYLLYCRELKNQKLIRPLGQNYRVVVEPFNYPLLERLKRELPQDLETVYYRARGREAATHAIYVEYVNQIVSSSFAQHHRTIISPSGYELSLNQMAVQVFGVFIDPRYRLKGLHLHMLKAAYTLSREYGVPGLYGEIHYMNRNSLFSYNKLGFEAFKNIQYIQIFGKKRFFGGKPEFWHIFKKQPDKEKLKNLVAGLSKRLFNYWVDSYFVFKKNLRITDLNEAAAMPTGYSIRFIHAKSSDKDIEALGDFWQRTYIGEYQNKPKGAAHQQVHLILGLGDVCCGLYYHAKIVGMGWYGGKAAISRMDFAHLIRNEKNAVIGFHDFIDTQHRGHGLHRRMIAARMQHARQSGRQTYYSFVGVKNLAAVINSLKEYSDYKTICHLKIDIPFFTLNIYPGADHELWTACQPRPVSLAANGKRSEKKRMSA